MRLVANWGRIYLVREESTLVDLLPISRGVKGSKFFALPTQPNVKSQVLAWLLPHQGRSSLRLTSGLSLASSPLRRRCSHVSAQGWESTSVSECAPVTSKSTRTWNEPGRSSLTQHVGKTTTVPLSPKRAKLVRHPRSTLDQTTQIIWTNSSRRL